MKKNKSNAVTSATAKAMNAKRAESKANPVPPRKEQPLPKSGTPGIHRLRAGDVFIQRQTKKEMVVWYINDSRAAVAPLDSPIQYRWNEEKGKYEFLARDQNSENISPNSEVEIVRSLGRDGLAKYLKERAENINETRKDNMAKANKAKKEKGQNSGKLGGYKGHSITSVIRRMGECGWNLAEARAFFKREGIDVADNTIKIQIRKGAKGEEKGADISKDEMARIKPKVKAEESEKSSKKSSKKDKKAAKAAKKAKKAKKAAAEDEESEEEEAAEDSEQEEASEDSEGDEEGSDESEE